MKKSIAVTFLILMVSGLTFAQGISGGLRLGMNLANAPIKSGSVTITPDVKAGLLAGGYLSLMFSDNLGIQPEVQFSMQGANLDLAALGAGTGTLSEKLTYVNVPVFIKYNIIKILNVHAGPQFGMLVSAKSVANGTTTDIKNNFKSSDISAVFGAGLNLPFGISGGLRYSLGLTNIDGTNTSGLTIKNKTFQIYVGYRLFGKK